MIKNIVDDYNNKKASSSFLPVNEEEMAQTLPADSEQSEPAEKVAPEPESKPENKWNYSKEDIDTFTQFGLSLEQLEKHSKYDPSKGLAQLYKTTIPAPTAPDEKELRRGRIISSIGDGLGMLSQMWSAGKGAHVKERDYKDSASAKTEAKEKELRNVYQSRLDKYNEGHYMAQLKDLQQGHADYYQTQKEIRSILENKRKSDQLEYQFDARNKQAEKKALQDQENKDREYGLRKKNVESQVTARKESTAQGWAKVEKSAGPKGKGSKKDYGKLRFTTKQGRKSKEFDLNKDQDVLEMYKEGVRGGIYPELGYGEKINVDQLRSHILYNTGKQSPVKSTDDMETMVITAPWKSKQTNNANKAPWVK
ncbi:hypothetical protein [Bacteroides reticulotermitis]|uniref:hypothetical protein n=1 Tax=Bacteroides reticulotermitis TaxID=1133319 RepID=UPI003A8AD070